MALTEVLFWPTRTWKSLKVIAAKHVRSGKRKATRKRRTMACTASASQRTKVREGAELKFVQTPWWRACDKHKHQLSENSGQIALKSKSFPKVLPCLHFQHHFLKDRCHATLDSDLYISQLQDPKQRTP